VIEGVKVFSDLTATGALMWVVYYCLAVSIPNIIEKSDKRSAELVVQFLGALKETRDACKEELAAVRDHCAEELRIAREDEKENRRLLLEIKTLLPDKPCLPKL